MAELTVSIAEINLAAIVLIILLTSLWTLFRVSVFLFLRVTREAEDSYLLIEWFRHRRQFKEWLKEHGERPAH